MTDRELMEQALETAEGIVNADWRKWDELASPAEFERWAKSRANFMATALRERLAQPEPSPVGYIPVYELSRLQSGHDGRLRSAKFGASELDGDVAIYATPPQRKPLTDEEIVSLFVKCAAAHPHDDIQFARAVIATVTGEKE